MAEMGNSLLSRIVLDRMRCFTPIGAYRNEFAPVKTEIPEYGNCIWSTRTMEQMEAMAPLGPAGKENLRAKKRAYIRRRLGPATWQVAQKIAGFSLAQMLYMPQNGVQWYRYPFAKHTQIDALRQAGNGIGIASTSPGVILLLGFDQISHLVSTMEFVPRAWSRHNSGRQHV